MTILLLVIVAITTPQMRDTLVYGDNSFSIEQVPMLGLWDYSDGDPPAGKVKPPPFDVTSSANWAGYEATWPIHDSKLYLKSMATRRNGKKISEEQIFPNKQFPLHADWFSGKIHIAVGGYNQRTEKSESVITFRIENGVVAGTEFNPVLEIPTQWDGTSPAETNAPK